MVKGSMTLAERPKAVPRPERSHFDNMLEEDGDHSSFAILQTHRHIRACKVYIKPPRNGMNVKVNLTLFNAQQISQNF
jgi:hypothetical protein